jgi:hypothetical protein
MHNFVEFSEPVSLVPQGGKTGFRIKVQVRHKGKLINALLKDLTEEIHLAMNEEARKRMPLHPIQVSRRDVADALRDHLVKHDDEQLAKLIDANLWGTCGPHLKDLDDAAYQSTLIDMMHAANGLPAYNHIRNGLRNFLLNMIQVTMEDADAVLLVHKGKFTLNVIARRPADATVH